MSSEPTGECTAHDKHSNEECDCVDYYETPDIPGYCSNCYHRRMFHLVSRPGASKKNDHVKSLLDGMLAGRSSDTTKASTSKRSSLGAVVAASSSKSKSSALSAAHRESNHGMRPADGGGGGGGGSKPSKKGKGKNKKKQDIFKVISVQVIPWGTVVVGGVRQLIGDSAKIPDRVQTQTAKLDARNLVECDASHEEVVAALTELLPLLSTISKTCEAEAEQPAWDLATPVKHKLVIVPSDSERPDGLALDFNKGTGTAGYRNSRIFIASRDPIPIELLREWAGPNSSSFKQSPTSDDGSEVKEYMSDDSEDFTSHEFIPRANKRRISSCNSGDEDDEKPLNKKHKSLPRSYKITRSADLHSSVVQKMGEPFIDLTEDVHTSRHSTPDFLRKPPRSPPPREDPPSPGRSEPHHDPTLGNPYDQAVEFTF
ncbi:hypothetical protein B0H14DRAFT_2572054 [Mycena olivaceomarginata]|nr:hypothetical protein B0H14DRAFT_2572054 [Mycena olivaceomarginata]